MGWFSRQADLEVGQEAPDFDLPDHNGNRHRLADYRGRWVVLYFYPKDDTPGCTAEACGFRDDITELRGLGAEVLGVSTDDGASHARFAAKFGLPFPLLADAGGKTARAYGSLLSVGPLKAARRHTFLIDPGGRLARIWRKVEAKRHAAAVIEAVRTSAAA